MSSAPARISLDAALGIAGDVLRQISGEAIVVGSVRRRKPVVGDLEVVVHECARIDLDVGVGPLIPGVWRTIKSGPKYWQLEHRDSGVRLDLWRFDEINRGSITLIRTGPSEFSRRYVIQLRRRGLKHEGGYIRQEQTGVLVPCQTEREAFQLAGMRYVDPWHRDLYG